MPSSMIFAGLVVVWLLILVPAVSRHRQEVERPTVAALSGRVLERPRRRQNLEVDVMDSERTDEQPRTVATRTAPSATAGRDGEPQIPAAREEYVPEPADPHPAADRHEIDRDEFAGDDVGGDVGGDDLDGEYGPVDDRRWERPPPRYRPGRGGYDPEAAALTARARYGFRQRVVLALLVAALVTGVLAAVAIPGLWWPHAAVDMSLVGYLVYLRRQVRVEESIRDNRAARMAGTRRPVAAEDPDLDEWARRGRDVDGPEMAEPDDDLDPEEPVLDEPDDAERVVGVGEPLAALRERDEEPVPALPRLQPAPPPPLPPGTALVEADDEGPELHELDAATRPVYRRAVGE